MRRTLVSLAVVGLILGLVMYSTSSAQAPAKKGGGPVIPGASVSTGGEDKNPRVAHPTKACLAPVQGPMAQGIPAVMGEVTSTDGKKWTVPAPVEEGALAVDYFNDCTGPGLNKNWESELKTVVIDPDGVEITGFIFADNYFELYVNGKYVARDTIAMTPFNANVVRFKAKYPMTYAVKAVDWETHPGTGMEYNVYNLGDGGFIMYFSDGNRTDETWKVETFYIAPLDDPGCVRMTPQGRDSTFCLQGMRPLCAQKDPRTECYALHFPIPADWKEPKFNDSRWVPGTIWPAEEVTGVAAYWNVAGIFKNAKFIWTRNIRLDNLVLARYTAKGPRK